MDVLCSTTILESQWAEHDARSELFLTILEGEDHVHEHWSGFRSHAHEEYCRHQPPLHHWLGHRNDLLEGTRRAKESEAMLTIMEPTKVTRLVRFGKGMRAREVDPSCSLSGNECLSIRDAWLRISRNLETGRSNNEKLKTVSKSQQVTLTAVDNLATSQPCLQDIAFLSLLLGNSEHISIEQERCA